MNFAPFVRLKKLAESSRAHVTAVDGCGVLISLSFHVGLVLKQGNFPISLRRMAHAGSLLMPPPTNMIGSRHWRPIMRRHLRRRLNRLHRRLPQWCRRQKSPLTNIGGATFHRQPLRCHWHERVPRILRVAWMGGWHPCPQVLGYQRHRVPLATVYNLGGEQHCQPRQRQCIQRVKHVSLLLTGALLIHPQPAL